MLNTLYLQTFLAVVDAGNYTAAAEYLHMSQPAVSQHIRSLEEQLGNVRLFRRSGQRMVPTHAGEELLAMARELVLLVERTEQNIQAMRGQTVGRVRIGCVPGSGEYLLPPVLAAFHVLYPDVALALQVAPGETLLHNLAERQIDLVVLGEQHRRRGWETVLWGSEPLVVLAPLHHPLLHQAAIHPADLHEQPCILPPPGRLLRRTIEDGLRKRGLPSGSLRVVLECDGLLAMQQAVRHNIGLAFLPQSCVSEETRVGRLTLREAPLQQDWYVLRERGKKTSRAAQELFAFLISVPARELLARYGLSMPGN